MKKFLIIIIPLFFVTDLSAQYVKKENRKREKEDTELIDEPSNLTSCLTIGILQGGGSLVGADIETLLSDNFGIQVGAGLVGFGAAANFHFKPSIRSSFLSLTYWHQGIGESFAQSVLGGTYVYRSKKWFTFQINLGVPLAEGPAWDSQRLEQPPVMLMYSIGAYIPW